jgi:hypothetical protein
MASVTNAVLSERQEQQHTQTMVLLAQIADKLTTINGCVRSVQISDAEQELRLKCSEKRLGKIETEQKETQARFWRIAVAIALLAGAGMAGAEKALSLIMP